MPASPPRRALCALLLLAQLVQAGCASAPRQPDRSAAQLGRVAVVAAAQQPEIRLHGLVRGKGSGAAAGAGSTFAHCLEPLGQSSCSGDFCGAVLILWFGVCGVAGLVGGVVGAVQAPSANAVRQTENRLRAGVDAGAIQTALRDQVVQLARDNSQALVDADSAALRQAARDNDYRPLAAAGIDSVLEVALREVATRGSAGDTPQPLLMQARVRLIRTADNHELGQREFVQQSERRRLAEWAAADGRVLLQALQNGYAALGAQIYDSEFLLYPFPDRGMHATGWLAAAFGLAPLAPRVSGQLSGSDGLTRALEWRTVDSTQPTLRWQAFPRPSDRAAAPAEMARVANVRYDLVIAEERALAPARIVYRGENLVEPQLRLSSPLRANGYYFWSVRARFTLDGRERVTEWGALRAPGNVQMATPSPWSYRFHTP